MQEWFHKLEAWRDFYAFAGTAAATLMGLMFVIVSLGQRLLATEEGTRATRGFFTPIVVFFATVILVTMLMLVPETPPSVLGTLLAVLALVGFMYMIASGAHRIWKTNELGFDDLIFYVLLPYVSYAALGVAAAGAFKASVAGLYAAAAAMLLFLLVSIRNAWDLIVYQIQRGDQ